MSIHDDDGTAGPMAALTAIGSGFGGARQLFDDLERDDLVDAIGFLCQRSIRKMDEIAAGTVRSRAVQLRGLGQRLAEATEP